MTAVISYKTYFLQLPQTLLSQYPDLPLEDHSYLRIALDNAIGTKWDIRIAKPAYKHLSIEQRKAVIANLMCYLYNKQILLEHLAISNMYRSI